MLVLLAGCGNLSSGGVIFGGPTVLVSRENFSLSTETDQNGNTFYIYGYTLALFTLPGSGVGSVVLLDASDNPVDVPFTIPQACPPLNPNPCGPYTRSYQKRVSAPLAPVQVVKYRTVSANGQSKVISLPAPIEIY
ncbi:hypothetical protein [Thermus sp.]|uniref:hypothetical protein n=1 Tax=Thermus sp. TaxID=275 RepID=UPI003D0B09B4